MNHIQESKQTLQSEELWFSKTNYMAKFLSEKSKTIIDKINKKKYEKFNFNFNVPSVIFCTNIL